MAIKTANEDIRKRISSAAAHIGLGVRYGKPEVEEEGRRQSALAHIENQILLGLPYLTSEDVSGLASILFRIPDNASELDSLRTVDIREGISGEDGIEEDEPEDLDA